jgi:hypothetical protein
MAGLWPFDRLVEIGDQLLNSFAVGGGNSEVPDHGPQELVALIASASIRGAATLPLDRRVSDQLRECSMPAGGASWHVKQEQCNSVWAFQM